MSRSTHHNSDLYNHLLAKAISYDLPLEKKEKSNVFALRDIITNHEVEQNELDKRTAEIASTEITASWEQESITRAQAAINRLYRRVQDNPELSEWQIEVLDKANQYGIKYSFDNIDWFMLSDMIDELEPLIKEAEEYGIYDWDANDLVDIRQRIEHTQRSEYRVHRQHCGDYLMSRL